MIARDNIHFNFRKIDGYNLPFNFVISEREAGKSTAVWLDKAYKGFVENGWTTLVIRRKVVHITKAYIDDIAQIINKFTDDKIQFQYSQSTLKEGIVDIYINEKRFMRVCALSIDITALKSLVLRDLKYIIFDEFICNQRAFGEKYLGAEATKFMEVYNTFRRESEGLKCYFLGNPYSLYNPYFMFFNIDSSKLKRGAIISDKKSYVIQCYEITPELRAKILEENPLYQFDNAYTKYAFEGKNVNDLNIIIKDKLPPSFKLIYVFKTSNKYIGLYRSSIWEDNEIIYYAEFIEGSKISKRRDIICFDFGELVDRAIILSPDERYKFQKIKDAMRKRLIAFNSIECYYLLEEIYFNL